MARRWRVARKTVGGISTKLPRTKAARRGYALQNECVVRKGVRIGFIVESDSTSSIARESSVATSEDDIRFLRKPRVYDSGLPGDIKKQLRNIAHEMEVPFCILWETNEDPPYDFSLEWVPEGSERYDVLNSVVTSKRLDYNFASICRAGPPEDEAYKVIASKNIPDDTPLIVDVGDLVSRSSSEQSRNGQSPSMASLFTSLIPGKLLQKLSAVLGVNTYQRDDDCTGYDLILESGRTYNESRYFSDYYWSTGSIQDAPESSTCGPYFVFSKQDAIPYLMYFTKAAVPAGSELLTFWGRDTWKTIASVLLKCYGETISWSHQYCKSLYSILRQLADPRDILFGNKRELRRMRGDLENRVLYIQTETRNENGICLLKSGKEGSASMCYGTSRGKNFAHPLGNDYITDSLEAEFLPELSTAELEDLFSSLSFDDEFTVGKYRSQLSKHVIEALESTSAAGNCDLSPAGDDVLAILQKEDEPTAVCQITDGFCPPRFLCRPDELVHGLKASRFIGKGMPVAVYVGLLREYETLDEGGEREKYAYEISKAALISGGYPEDAPELVVENLRFGNTSRFVNDSFLRSAATNCEARILWWEAESVPLIVLYASVNIYEGSEIIVDYDAGMEGEASSYWRILWKDLIIDLQRFYCTIQPVIECLEEAIPSELRPAVKINRGFQEYTHEKQMYKLIHDLYREDS